MSKKIISLVLAVMLTVSMISVAAISVSADIDDKGCYTPSTSDTYRYYFYLPDDWKNDKATTAGVYWWAGTDACGAADGTNPDAPAWPGYTPQQSEENPNIYYIDCPTDVTTIIWNNGFNGGEDTTSPDYAKAIQTVNIGSEYYDPGESTLYPDGTDNFNNMIYVVDPNKIDINEFNGKMNCGGEWYYYYGNGEYGVTPEKGDTVYNTEYQPPKTAPTTDPTTTGTTTGTTSTVAPTEPATTVEPTTAAPQVAPLTVNATSNYFPDATAQYNADTNEVTVTYMFQSSKDVLNDQWHMTYDKNVLSISTKNTPFTVTPVIGVNGGVLNLDDDKSGNIYGNASNLGLYDFSSAKKVFVSMIFDVNKDYVSANEPVNTTVDLDLEVLNVSKIGPDYMTDTNEEVKLVDDSKVLDNDKTATVTTTRETTLTESTFVPTTAPTTVAPTTVAPTTAKPTTTVAPSTSATTASTTATEATTVTDATTASDATTATTATDATSATGATVNGSSTSDTANNNGAVQTGDASLAVIILTLLIAATGVMFVLRKREMF